MHCKYLQINDDAIIKYKLCSLFKKKKIIIIFCNVAFIILILKFYNNILYNKYTILYYLYYYNIWYMIKIKFLLISNINFISYLLYFFYF